MIARILPGKASGTVPAPPSKSMAHRLLIAAALAEGASTIQNVALSQDMLATADSLAILGQRVQIDNGTAVLAPSPAANEVCVRESGSTLRFLIPLALTLGHPVTFTGAKRLFERPLSVYEEIAQEEGFQFDRQEDRLTVCGRLQPRTYRIRGDVSSQFVSGLLFALPGLSADSRIELIPPVESRPYIDMTMQALSLFGVRTCWVDDRTILVSGNQHPKGRSVTVEGDYSNAAFLEVLNLFGGDVQVTGLSPDSLQGDRIYQEYFPQLKEDAPVLDISDCPDLGPVLFAAAAVCGGGSFTGTERLRIKESDRLACMQKELAKFGIQTEIGDNTFTVLPGMLKEPAERLCGHNDHRIVMALSSLLTLTGGEIEGAEAVQKSWPDYFLVLQNLGIEVVLHAVDQ